MPATVWPVCPMSLIELPTSRSVQPSPSQLKTQWSRDNATSGTPRLLLESRPNVTVVVSRG